jgi:hypothetical protein
VLAFFTPGGELDHFLFAQQAMRAFGAAAQAGGYAFAATSDWDALNEPGLRDVRVVMAVIWTNRHYKARNVYFQFGHKPDLFQNGAFTTLFRNAVRWASTR